jgi:sporulation protein YlmC with PRC-barrel domain
MSRAVFLAAALVFGPLPALCQGTPGPTGGQTASSAAEGSASAKSGHVEVGEVLDRLAHSGIRDRLAAAADRVEDACADDIEELCGGITPGEGRLGACVRANADQLSRRCRLTLFIVSRKIRQTVADFADECGGSLRAQCAGAEKFGDCAEQKSESISPACHTMVVALRHAGQKLSNLKGVSVYSSDGKDVGQVVEAVRGPDGKIQSVQIQIGRLLGIGDKVVSIDADKLQEMRDRIALKLNTDQVRSQPEAKK